MSDRISIEDLDIAILWLKYNEGEHGEAEACARVAKWLEKEAARREMKSLEAASIRATARVIQAK